ncbi:unnamed protein product [Chrysoparadoxa australica]
MPLYMSDEAAPKDRRAEEFIITLCARETSVGAAWSDATPRARESLGVADRGPKKASASAVDFIERSLSSSMRPKATKITPPRVRSKSFALPKRRPSKSGLNMEATATPKTGSKKTSPTEKICKSIEVINPLATPRGLPIDMSKGDYMEQLATPTASMSTSRSSSCNRQRDFDSASSWHSRTPIHSTHSRSKTFSAGHLGTPNTTSTSSSASNFGLGFSYRSKTPTSQSMRMFQQEEVPQGGPGLAAALDKMLRHGINLDMVNAQGMTGQSALHTAAWTGKVEMAKVLLSHHADVEAKDELGRTPLHLAAVKGHAAIVRLLLSHAAITSVQDEAGDLPLHCAASWGHRQAVHALLGEDGEIWVVNNDGETPRQAALKNGHNTVADILAAEEKRQLRSSFRLKKTLKKKASLVWDVCTGRTKILSAKSSAQSLMDGAEDALKAQAAEADRVAEEEECANRRRAFTHDECWEQDTSPSMFGDRATPDW